MKTTQKLMLLCALFTTSTIAGLKVYAQPLPLEIAECQDFFGSLQRGDLNSIKACLDKKPEYIYKLDEQGASPLMVASQAGHAKTVAYLLKSGADLQETTNAGIQAIHLAAKKGSLETVKLLVNEGAKINAGLNNGTQVIHYAAWSGNLKLLQYLEKKGADISLVCGNGGSLMLWTAMGGNIEAFKYLESKNLDITVVDRDGDGALHWAATGINPEMCKFLINQRSFDIRQQNTSGKLPIEVGIGFRQLETTKYFLSDGIDINEKNTDDASWLHIAARSGSTAITEYLIDNGCKINAIDGNGSTPLNEAAASGNLELVKLLVDKGAEVNPKDCFGGKCNLTDGSPLHNAVWRNSAIITYLIEKGAKIDQKNQIGQTPLHIASGGRCIDCVKELLEAGADINIQDNEGRTAVHMAIKRERKDILEYLLTHEANLNIAENTGKTPVHYAAICGYSELIAVMKEKGADVCLIDNEGNTPLFYANYYSNTNTAKSLLKAGAKEDVFAYVDYCHKELKKGEAIIWYLNHSGFAVKTANNLLVFDYWQQNEAPDRPCINNGHICSKEMKEENVTVFVSHAHTDHYDRVIFEWAKDIKHINYVLGFETEAPVDYAYIEPQITKKVNGIKITPIESTDSGEGFLVEVDGVTIFHPGDHANGNRNDATDYTEDIDFIAKKCNTIDIGFFPITGCRFPDKVALKQGVYYAVEKLNPKIAFTMHGTTHEGEYKKFAKEANGKISGNPFLYTLNKGDRYFYSKGQDDTSDLNFGY